MTSVALLHDDNGALHSPRAKVFSLLLYYSRYRS